MDLLIQDIQLEKFANRRPTCIDFDDQMQKYSAVQKEIARQPLKREVEFVMLRLDPLSRSLQDSARQWILSLGKLLNGSAKDHMTKLKEEMNVCKYMYLIQTNNYRNFLLISKD